MFRTIFRICLLTLIAAGTAASQPPETLWVPVTFFDFHSDGSNPEFEQPHRAGVRHGMVADTLDPQGRPVPGPSPYMNRDIRYWFRPWEDSAQGDSTIPLYDPPGEFTGDGAAGHDTAFKNIVIRDSLPFIHLRQGIYQFSRTGNGEPPFFMLDNRGFGNEGRDHNYSFAMALHCTFFKQRGMSFSFNGDDDVWVFVDRRLAMSLGGIHAPADGSFSVDDIPGLTDGASYAFDLFYAERHTVMSTIRITTNIMTRPPRRVRLHCTGGGRVRAGDTARVWAEVISDTGAVSRPAGVFSWTLSDSTGRNLSSALIASNTAVAQCAPAGAHTRLLIAVEYHDVFSGVTLSGATAIAVAPGDPARLVMEPGPAGPRWTPDPRIRVRLAARQTTDDALFAIWRDRFGNYVQPATGVQWSVGNRALAAVAHGARPGQARVTRLSSRKGECVLTVRDADGRYDSATVQFDDAVFDSLRICTEYRGKRLRVDTVVIAADGDTALYAEGFNSGTRQWEGLDCRWSTAGLKMDPSTPFGPASSWLFRPAAHGSGTCTVRSGAPGADRMRSVVIAVAQGAPHRVALYPAGGDPATQKPFTDTIYAIAGRSVELHVFVFDILGGWLKEYREADSLAGRLSWQSGDPSDGTLNACAARGCAVFGSNTARTYAVTAAVNAGVRNIRRAFVIAVAHAPPAQLVLEPDNRGKERSSGAAPQIARSVLTLYDNSGPVHLFAVLRDRFGNWAGFVRDPVWSPADSLAVTVEPGAVYQGEGMLTRGTRTAGTTVTVTDPATGLSSALDVRCSGFHYDRLAVFSGFEIAGSPLDSVSVSAGAGVRLVACGRRSNDTAAWDTLACDWITSHTATGRTTVTRCALRTTVATADTGVVLIGAEACGIEQIAAVHFRMRILPAASGFTRRTPAAIDENAIRVRVEDNAVVIWCAARLPSAVTIDVFAANGQQLNSYRVAGQQGAAVRWDLRDGGGRRVLPGMYLLRMRVGDMTIKRRVMVKR